MVFQARKTIKVTVHYENLIELTQSVHMSGFHPLELEENSRFQAVWM